MTTDTYYNNMKVSYMGKYPAVYFPSHHRAAQCGLVYVHYLVAETMLNRELFPEECVHHVDEDKWNYCPENIWVFATNAAHACYHEAIKNGTDYCIFKLNGVHHCFSGEYSVSEGLKAIKHIQNTKPAYRNKVCPECGAPMATKAILCRKCRDHKRILENINSKEQMYGIDRNTLKQEIRTTSFVQLSKKYGVSDNAIRKWCKAYGLPCKAKDIKRYSEQEWLQV